MQECKANTKAISHFLRLNFSSIVVPFHLFYICFLMSTLHKWEQLKSNRPLVCHEKKNADTRQSSNILFMKIAFGQQGGSVVSTVTSLRVLSVWSSFCCAWVSSGCSGFLPPPKDIQVKQFGDSNLATSVNVFVCLHVLALWQTGDLSRVRPVSHPMCAGKGSSPLRAWTG